MPNFKPEYFGCTLEKSSEIYNFTLAGNCETKPVILAIHMVVVPKRIHSRTKVALYFHTPKDDSVDKIPYSHSRSVL